MKLLNKLLSAFIVMLVAMTSITVVEAKALNNGVYIAPVSVDYRNPETGLIEDGGSEENYELGLGMCRSIVGSQALIEVENGKKYVTLRFSLMSNISSVNIAVQGSSRGSYYNVSPEVTKTGNDTKDYRFQVTDENLYISPTMYVTPMQRNVKFFVRVNGLSASPGSGDFVTKVHTTTNNNQSSQQPETNSNNIVNNDVVLIETAEENQTVDVQEVSSNNETENEVDKKEDDSNTDDISQENNIEDEKGTSEHNVSTKTVSSKNDSKEKGNKGIIITIVTVGILGVAGVLTKIIYDKRKKR